MWGLESTAIPGILSLGWLLFTLLLGIYGLSTIVISKGKAAEIAIGAGLVYFYRGIWFTLYQYQFDLFEANVATHALSSVHFHFHLQSFPFLLAHWDGS